MNERLTGLSDLMADRRRLIVWVAVAVVAAFAFLRFVGNTDQMSVTAYFTQTKGLYVGDSVTYLGISIGKVTAIEPEPDRVRVRMRIDSDVPLGEDVRAAVAAPALVTVRTLAVGPAYNGGPRLEDGAEIPLSRTLVPVEFDQVKDQLTRLAEALGPNGANRNGALNGLISSSAEFLRGNGSSLKRTISDLSAAMTTLSDNRGELFATVRNLQVFVSALRGSDEQVGLFNTRLASVSGALAEDRTALAEALKGLRRTFVDVNGFLRANDDLTLDTLEQLRGVTSVLAENRQGLADLLQLAPTSVSNFYNIMDPNSGALTGVAALVNQNNPGAIICGSLLNLGGNANDCYKALGPLVDFFDIGEVPVPPVGLPPALPEDAGGSGADAAPGPDLPFGSLLGGMTELLGGGGR